MYASCATQWQMLLWQPVSPAYWQVQGLGTCVNIQSEINRLVGCSKHLRQLSTVPLQTLAVSLISHSAGNFSFIILKKVWSKLALQSLNRNPHCKFYWAANGWIRKFDPSGIFWNQVWNRTFLAIASCDHRGTNRSVSFVVGLLWWWFQSICAFWANS